MNFMDMIKKSVVEEFTGTISVDKMVFSLHVSFLIGLFIVYIYRKTYTGVVYSKSFSLCIILLSMVTAMIIRTISSNLALSLGMVGALSIVRFRTAVKEPVDTGFMFWGITAGIMSGAGLYLISILASVLLGLLYVISYSMGFRVSSNYLLIVKYEAKAHSDVNKIMKKINKKKLKSKTLSKNVIELTFEIELKDIKEDFINQFEGIEGVKTASLISYQNDFGA